MMKRSLFGLVLLAVAATAADARADFLYISVSSLNKVSVVNTANGAQADLVNLATAVPGTAFGQSSGIAFAPDGNSFYLGARVTTAGPDQNFYRILRFANDGTFLDQSANLAFNDAVGDLAVDAAGGVYAIVGSRVDRYDAGLGGAATVISGATLRRLDFEASGSLVATTSTSVLRYVAAELADGLPAVGGTAFITGLNVASGLAVDRSGDLIVGTFNFHTYKYSAAGSLLATYQPDGSSQVNGLEVEADFDNFAYVLNAPSLYKSTAAGGTTIGVATFSGGLNGAVYVAALGVPEPSSVALLGLGGVALAALGRARRIRRPR